MISKLQTLKTGHAAEEWRTPKPLWGSLFVLSWEPTHVPNQVCSPETTDVKAVWVDLPEKGPGTSQCGRAEDNDRGEGSKNEINNEMEKKIVCGRDRL